MYGDVKRKDNVEVLLVHLILCGVETRHLANKNEVAIVFCF